MEGYYQYTVSINEGDETRDYNGVVYSNDGYASTANRISSWYQNYGTIVSIMISALSSGAVCELPTKENETSATEK